MGTHRAVLEVKGISKRYLGVAALDGVSLAIEAGEIRGLVGQNGAGKSTLVKTITGVVKPDAGFVRCGEEQSEDAGEARLSDIAVVYQDLELCPNLTVADNFALAQVASRNMGVVNRRSSARAAQVVLQRLGTTIDVYRAVSDLAVADRQLVAVARSVHLSRKVLILDEPTASLGAAEATRLFAVLRSLAAAGTAVLFITHRLSEVLALCDSVTVLRDGRVVQSAPVGTTSERELVTMIVGHEVRMADSPMRPDGNAGSVPLRATIRPSGRIAKEPILELELASGSVVGLLGLPGSGREEIVRALGGQSHQFSATLEYKGRRLAAASVLGNVLASVPSDRLVAGVFGHLSVLDNISVGVHHSGRWFWRRRKKEAQISAEIVNSLQLRCRNLGQTVRTLSGGNQQKAVIARAIANRSDFVSFDEPTNGIDVESREDVYRIIGHLAASGKGVLVGSQDADELVRICDSIVVVFNSNLAGVFEPPYRNEELVMAASSGSGSGPIPA